MELTPIFPTLEKIDFSQFTGHNPLFDIWNQYVGPTYDSTQRMMSEKLFLRPGSYTLRDRAVRQFSWAVPDDRAIDVILSHSPIIEVGAGTGYWAKLVQEIGGDILPFDKSPPKENANNPYGHKIQHTKVLTGTEKIVAKHPNRTLMLCWPGALNPQLCLDHYEGDTVIYIGEPRDGCTAWADDFEDEYKWKIVEQHPIPQWDGIHDTLLVFKRV